MPKRKKRDRRRNGRRGRGLLEKGKRTQREKWEETVSKQVAHCGKGKGDTVGGTGGDGV